MQEPQFEHINEFIRAGAGAGKTHNLTRKVIELALKHKNVTGQWPRTVMTTFTRKATQELKERLLIYCLEEKQEALEFVKSTSFLTITTMHGLFNLFLGRYGQVLGLPNQFKVVDSQTVDFWRKQILKEKVASLPKNHILNVFNFSQLLNHLKHYEEIYWLQKGSPVSSSTDYESLFEELNQEIAQRLRDLIRQGSQEVEGEKWQEFFEGLEDLRGELILKKPWNEMRAIVFEKSKVLKKPRKTKNNPDWSEDSKKQYTQITDRIKKWYGLEVYSDQLWSRSLAIFDSFMIFAQECIEDLISKKLKESSIEPNDLEYFSYKALKEKPELIQKFSMEVDTWFIDEFQDTSPLQIQILEAMMNAKSRYMVGDPQQSIYLFRGSRSEVFFNKKEIVEREGGFYEFRRVNRRSQEKLLNFFNQFFPNLSSEFSEMEPFRESNDSGPSVTVSVDSTEDHSAEVLHIGHQILQLLEQGVNPKEICLLTRTKKEIEKLQKSLMAMGFPIMSHASSSFYQRREILDSLSLLKFLINPWDDHNLLILLRSPWVALSDEEIVETIGKDKSHFWSSFREDFSKKEEEHPGRILFEAQKRTQVEGLAWVFRHTMIKLGVIDFSNLIDPTGRREANLWKLLNMIEKKAREPGSSLLQFINEGFKAGQLEEIGDASDASSPVEPNKINLMTVHASKGLQFDYVFLPFLHRKPRETTFNDFSFWDQKKLWSFRVPLLSQHEFVGDILEYHTVSEMKKREEEESLRVLYVAMTRAREKLYLSWHHQVESRSWAEHLVRQQNDLSAEDYVEWCEVENSSKVFYQEGKEHSKIRVPWDDKSVRFLEPLSDETTQPSSSDLGDWETFEQEQKRRRQGVVLHKVFESLKNFDREQVLALAQHWLPEQKDKIEEAIEFVWENSDVPFKDLIRNGKVEWGYQWEKENSFEEKRIDLWGIVDDTLWVVDYKTGNPRFQDKAFEQISTYSEALVEYNGWDKAIKWAAVYPFDKKVFIKDR